MAYIKQNWKNGDIITADRLNHIEDGIANASVLVLYTYRDEDTNTEYLYYDEEYTELFAQLDYDGIVYSSYADAKSAMDNFLEVLNGYKTVKIANAYVDGETGSVECEYDNITYMTVQYEDSVGVYLSMSTSNSQYTLVDYYNNN